jgi:hypothetical protein
MKRVKFMLLSLTLLAVVGGALAFKAKFDIPYCHTLDLSGTKTSCPIFDGFKDDPIIGNTTVFTTTDNNGTCFDSQNKALRCLTTTQSSTFD